LDDLPDGQITPRAVAVSSPQSEDADTAHKRSSAGPADIFVSEFRSNMIAPVSVERLAMPAMLDRSLE
jgi:hypothetical protein